MLAIASKGDYSKKMTALSLYNIDNFDVLSWNNNTCYIAGLRPPYFSVVTLSILSGSTDLYHSFEELV